MRLDGKTAFTTGAGSEPGGTTAERFVAEGVTDDILAVRSGSAITDVRGHVERLQHLPPKPSSASSSHSRS